METDHKKIRVSDRSWFPRPEFIKQAAMESKGWLLIVEIIIFIVMWKLFYGGEYVGFIVLHTLLTGVGLSGSMMPDWADIVLNNLLFGAGVLVILFYCRLVEKRRLRTMGFVKKRCGAEFLVGLAAGFSAFAACVLFALLLGAAQNDGMGTADWPALLLVLLSYVLQSAVEETVFRGYFMVSLSRRYPLWLAAALSALMFAAVHLGNPGAGPMVILNIFLIGLFLSMLILKRGNIWVACGFHAMWNFAQGNIFGMSVSGLNMSNNTIFKISPASGSPLLTGGTFGLEAAFEATVIAVLMILLVLKLPAVDRSKEVHVFFPDDEN